MNYDRLIKVFFLYLQVLKDVVLQPGGLYIKEHQTSYNDVTYTDIPAGVKGFYFSAHWVSFN